MSELTMQSDAQRSELGSSPTAPQGWVQPPRAEDEGLSLQEIRWIPLAVPLAALTLLLGAAAVLGMA